MAARRQWSLAIILSATAHFLVFAFMISGMQHTLPPAEDEAIQVFLDRPRLPEPPPPPEPKPEPLAQAPRPRPEPAPATRPVPAPPQPVYAAPSPPAGAYGNGQTPARVQGGQVAGPVVSPGAKPPCLGKYIDKMQGKERLDCETQVYAFIDRKAVDPLALALDPAKQAAYDAAIAKKAARRASGGVMGNKTNTNCSGGNLGIGCMGDDTVPLTGAAGRNFRQGERTPKNP